MAFDQTTRNRLQKLVSDCRKALSDEFRIQVQQIYGLDPSSGDVTPLDRLSDLSDRERQTAQILRDTLDHYLAGGTKDNSHTVAVIDRIIREQAFTVLNRLAAILMMEARGIVRPSVSHAEQSQAFELYKYVAGSALGETGDAYRTFLFSVFDEFAQDLPSLFDRFAPQGRLFPRAPALLQVLELLNHHDTQAFWGEDETIGWIYQYFNSKEERKTMRDASQAPRNSRELAVRNQFFTPRYVVEFLVDNTLGRLWFNATGGQTVLRDLCQYLTIKADEQPERAKRLRDPRTLKLLDPACGSMHFGLYAFDIFLEIYREAWWWEQQHGPGSLDVSSQSAAEFRPLIHTYGEIEAYLRDVPRLIIEHNIYGVDIDQRAAQIASLALWLRAERAWHDAGFKAHDRPIIGRGQVIAATAPPAERELQQQFSASLDKRDAELFKKTLQLLTGLPELGILLRVEQELHSLIREVFGEHGPMFSSVDMDQWQKAEIRLRDALTEFSHSTKPTYRSRLFTEDALQGLRIIDLAREKFDVIVMNPPFGAPSEGFKDYVFDKYPLDKTEVAACFVSRCLELLNEQGLLGAITNRTFVFSDGFQDWRGSFLKNINICADLGFGVLDALVETAAYTISRNCDESATFIALTNSRCKDADLLSTIKQGFSEENGTGRLIHRPRSALSKFGTEWFYYWLPESVLLSSAMVEARRLGIIAKPGLQTCDNFRFLRLAWECKVDESFAKAWPRLTKGGEYQPFWADVYLVANWRSNGAEMKAFVESAYQSWSKQIPSVDLYFKPGLTYSERTTSSLSLRILPEGCLFDKQGPFIGYSGHPQALDDILVFLGFSYSYIFKCLVESRVGLRDATEAGSPARHYMPSMIERLPLPALDDSARTEIINWVHQCIEVHRRIGALDVTDSFHCGYPGLSSVTTLSEYHSLLGKKISDSMELLYIGLENVNNIMAKQFKLDGESHRQLLTTFGPEIKNTNHELILENIEDIDKLLNIPESELINLVGEKKGLFSNILKQSFIGNRKLELVSILLDISPLEILPNIKSYEWLINHSDLCKNLIDYFVGVAFGRWDIRYCFDPDFPRPAQNPFESILICPPGQFKNKEGVPITHFAASALQQSTTFNYPLKADCNGILVDDPGHILDISEKLHQVIECLWPSKGCSYSSHDFEKELCESIISSSFREYFRVTSNYFEDHLKRYSKSRRKAPVYWPLATESSSYAIWVYYPEINGQTLYTAINDFVDPKIKQVAADIVALRNKGGARTREDEQQFESLQVLEHELIELRDTLLKIAQTYRPNHDDGVQISAAPLWPLFRHKSWQKVLKDTWAKLEKGDYDWAHLAMNYWPDRVRAKCKTDKSLAIAHGLEDLYVEPDSKPKKAKGRKKASSEE